VKLAQRGRGDHPDLRVFLETEAYRVQMVLVVRKVTMVQLEGLVLKERQDSKEKRDSQDKTDHLDLRVLMAHQALS
jgi:hypothetical protein